MIESIVKGYGPFLVTVIDDLEKVGVHLDEIKEIDHICYRVETPEVYESIKQGLIEDGLKLILEEPVSGRPISIFELKDPLACLEGRFIIRYLELPAPKPGKFYRMGLEHADFLIETPLAEFIKQHGRAYFETDALNKEGHSEIALRFQWHSAKFCNESILEVVRAKTGG